MNSTSPAEKVLKTSDMDIKSALILQARSVKLFHHEIYNKILADHDIIDGQLFKLSVEKLQELVEELEREAKNVQG